MRMVWECYGKEEDVRIGEGTIGVDFIMKGISNSV